MAQTAPGFSRPSSVRAAPGTEAAQQAYPWYAQFGPDDDERFWFYNSMHFPEPMCVFDMITAEGAYLALGACNTRVHSLPTTKGIDFRVINGRIYIGGVGVTDPEEQALRTSDQPTPEAAQSWRFSGDNMETTGFAEGVVSNEKVAQRPLIH